MSQGICLKIIKDNASKSRALPHSSLQFYCTFKKSKHPFRFSMHTTTKKICIHCTLYIVHSTFSQEYKHDKYLMKYKRTITDNANFLIHSLLTLPLQQEVATEAALTLIPNTVVLTAHTHSIVLSRALCCPLFNLRSISIQRRTQALQQNFINCIQREQIS